MVVFKQLLREIGNLILAGIVALIILLITGLFYDGGYETIAWIWLAGASYYFYKYIKKSFRLAYEKRIQVLSKFNADHGTNFSMEMGFGDFRSRFYIDEKTRKFLRFDELKPDDYLLFDFDYVTKWELTWDWKMSGNHKSYSKIIMSLTTTDIKKPIIKIGFNYLSDGEKLKSTLDILLG